MPHIILKGIADFASFHNQFQPSQVTDNGWIVKLRGCYLRNELQNMLFDCTGVRSGFSQDFYIRVEQKQGSVTVRLDPYMRIERNEGVQRCIRNIALDLVRQQAGRLSFDKSNLPPELLAGLTETVAP